MASLIVKEFLPATNAYINFVFETVSIEKGGHHNYMVEQLALNNSKPLDDMSERELMAFDNLCFDTLRTVDNNEPKIGHFTNVREIGGTLKISTHTRRFQVKFIIYGLGNKLLVDMVKSEGNPVITMKASVPENNAYCIDEIPKALIDDYVTRVATYAKDTW